MSNIKSNLVFDFPDPSPRFDFEEPASTVKRSRFKGATRGFGKFKSSKASSSTSSNSNRSHGLSLSSPSPDKSTATTASASSFDESAFDDLDDEVFDFGRSRKNGGGSTSRHNGSPSNTNTGNNNNSYSRTVPSKPSFEFADPTPTHHKPLKLPSSQYLPDRLSSNHSNTGYISEVSEFSFDRVTVNTVETPMTGVSSNVSSNFFEETKDLMGGPNGAGGGGVNSRLKDDLGFVPYTGSSSSRSKNNFNIRSLLETPHPTSAGAPRQEIKINLDNISLSDQSNELPISGIVGSNQSVVSEISDVNMDQEEDDMLKNAVKRHLREEYTNDQDQYQYRYGGNSRVHSKKNQESQRITPSPPPTNTKQPMTPNSLNYSEDPSKATATAHSILEEIMNYKQQRMHYLQFKRREKTKSDNAKKSSSKKTDNDINDDKEDEKNVLETIVGNVCLGIGFCTWYLCGTDTTLSEDHAKQVSKEERQREMDDAFLGRVISCNCQP